MWSLPGLLCTWAALLWHGPGRLAFMPHTRPVTLSLHNLLGMFEDEVGEADPRVLLERMAGAMLLEHWLGRGPVLGDAKLPGLSSICSPSLWMKSLSSGQATGCKALHLAGSLPESFHSGTSWRCTQFRCACVHAVNSPPPISN